MCLEIWCVHMIFHTVFRQLYPLTLSRHRCVPTTSDGTDMCFPAVTEIGFCPKGKLTV